MIKAEVEKMFDVQPEPETKIPVHLQLSYPADQVELTVVEMEV